MTKELHVLDRDQKTIIISLISEALTQERRTNEKRASADMEFRCDGDWGYQSQLADLLAWFIHDEVSTCKEIFNAELERDVSRLANFIQLQRGLGSVSYLDDSYFDKLVRKYTG